METTVPGLSIFTDFITEREESILIRQIDEQPWIVDYKRRLQYYGYRNELEKPYDLIEFPIPMPGEIARLAERIVAQNLLLQRPDQVIINEYNPGEGIIPHKDRNYFDNQICGVNLGSGCVMRFVKDRTHEIVDVEIPRRSLYLMQDEARKKWKHGIAPRKKDNIDGNVIMRDRRVSITYRKVKPEQVKTMNPDGKVSEMLKTIFGVSI